MFIPSHISYDQWRIAICVHAFYPELMPDIILCVRNFLAVCGNDNVHVFLTIPEEHPLVPDLDCCSHLAVMAVPNRGYDIAPFFHTLNNLDLNDYDYIVKLHTKRDVDCFVNFRLLKGRNFVLPAFPSVLLLMPSNEVYRCWHCNKM